MSLGFNSIQSESDPRCGIIMSAHFTRIFRYHMLIWRYSGTWYGDQQTVAYIVWAIVLNALLVYFWAGIWFYLGGVADVMEANDVLTFGAIFALVSVKTVLFVTSRHQCSAIMAQIGRMEASIETDDTGAEQRIVARTAAEMRRVGSVIAVCGFMAAFTHFTMTQFVDGRRLLVFPASTPYEWEHNDWAFYGTNAFQLLFALYSATMLATLDIVGPHMYLSLRAFLEVLAVRSARIGVVDGGVRRADVWATRRCIEFHMDCLRLGGLVERMFGGHYFVQFGASSFGICTSAFVMSQVSGIGRSNHFAWEDDTFVKSRR